MTIRDQRQQEFANIWINSGKHGILSIANSWLGEHRNSSSHLYQVIREARGLNYGDYSYIENFPNGGARQMPPQNVARRKQIFEIWIRPVPNETRHFALRAALREFKTMVEKGMSEEDFQLTRGFLRKYVLQTTRRPPANGSGTRWTTDSTASPGAIWRSSAR